MKENNKALNGSKFNWFSLGFEKSRVVENKKFSARHGAVFSVERVVLHMPDACNLC